MVAVVALPALILGGAVFAILLLLHPTKVFIGYLLIKPVVDRFAEHGVSIGGISIGYHYVPALVIPSILMAAALMSGRGFRELPYKGLILAFLALNVLSFLQEGDYRLSTAGWYIRIVFPFFLYFSVPAFVNKQADLLRLVRFAAYSGGFPCAMIFLQRLGYMGYNREAEALGSIVYDRATGGYADSFSVALPIIISVIFTLCLIEYHKKIKENANLLFVLLVAYLGSLIFTFHRMTYVVVALIIVIWIVFNKRVKYGLLFGAVCLVSLPVLIAFVPDFYSDIGIFQTETSGNVTVLNSKKNFDISTDAMHGRGRIWIGLLQRFTEASALDQIIGVSLALRAPHNDYLRILITNGALGFGIYVVLLGLMGTRAWKIYRYFTRVDEPFYEQFALAVCFMFLFYCLASVTLSVSLLSTITWYFWMSLGLVNIVYVIHRGARAPIPNIPERTKPTQHRPASNSGRAGRMSFRP